MPWFRLDDNFHQHPKVTSAGNAAVGLWVRCGTYSSSYLTDGHIPAGVARNMGNRREIDALLASRLWVENGDGFWMPDFLDYNPSAEQVRLGRKRDSERKRRGRDSQGRDPTNGQFTIRHDDDPFT